MSWHEPFEGTEEQFDFYVGLWHEDNCEVSEFFQWENTNWYLCSAGFHTYWSDGTHWWCRPFMSTDPR